MPLRTLFADRWLFWMRCSRGLCFGGGRIGVLALLFAACGAGSMVTAVRGEEPAARFLEQMRSAGYFDLALRYLERIEKYPGVSPEFLAAVELERAQTLIAAATQSRVLAQRDQYYADAGKALGSFLESQPQHPRRAEAQLQLGNLQFVRGKELMELGGQPNVLRRARALEAYSGAAATFNKIVQDLKELLLSMQGQKIDAAKEPEKLALRDRYRSEYLQALLAGGDAMKRAGDTFADDGPERTKWYDDALARFSELEDKYNDTLAGVLATLYAGQVYQAKGDTQRAADSFFRVLDQGDSDPLRVPKVKAVVGLMQLDLTKSPPLYQEAIQRGQPWADGTRPSEQETAEFQELRVVLADAYLGLIAGGQTGSEKRKSISAVRQLLGEIAKGQGPYQVAASSRLARALASVPGGPGEADEPVVDAGPLPTTFGESIALSNKIMDDERTKGLTIELLKQRASEGESLQGQIEMVQAELDQLRRRGVEVLQHALRQADSEVTENDLNAARYSLAYMLDRGGRHLEAAVVGDFVARNYPNSERALPCAQLAMRGWQLELLGAAQERLPRVKLSLQGAAQLLVDRWPADPQSSSARELLVRIAIDRDQYDKGERLLAQLPPEQPAQGELRRAMGRKMWNRSLALQQEGDLEAADAMRGRAGQTLVAGMAGLKPESVTPRDLQDALLLARVQMMSGDFAAALGTLDEPTYGPLKRLADVAGIPEDFRGNLFAIALQGVIAQLSTDGVDTKALLARAGEILEQLKASYQGQPDGEQQLTSTYVRLAGDIRKQLEGAPPAKKQRLTEGFLLFLNQLSGSTEDPKTLHWAGQTLLAVGESQIPAGQARATPEAEPIIRSAVTLLEKIESKGTAQPDWLGSPQLLMQIRLELARAARLTGQYKRAIEVLTSVLSESNQLIDAQEQAALAYEQWGATLEPKFAAASYERALMGSKPDPKTKRNILWGWGTIAKKTAGQKAFEENFFNARYHLAWCRFQQGVKETDQQRAKKLLAQASKDIGDLYLLYPQLGGKAYLQRFDGLLKEIQKSLGKSPVGLAEFPSSASPTATSQSFSPAIPSP